MLNCTLANHTQPAQDIFDPGFLRWYSYERGILGLSASSLDLLKVMPHSRDFLLRAYNKDRGPVLEPLIKDGFNPDLMIDTVIRPEWHPNYPEIKAYVDERWPTH